MRQYIVCPNCGKCARVTKNGKIHKGWHKCKRNKTQHTYAWAIFATVLFVVSMLVFYLINAQAYPQQDVPSLDDFTLELNFPLTFQEEKINIYMKCDSADGKIIAVGEMLSCDLTNIATEAVSRVIVNIDLFTVVDGNFIADYPTHYLKVPVAKNKKTTINLPMIKDGGKGFVVSFEWDENGSRERTYLVPVTGDNDFLFYVFLQKEKQEKKDYIGRIIVDNQRIRAQGAMNLLIQFFVVIQIFPAVYAIKKLTQTFKKS